MPVSPPAVSIDLPDGSGYVLHVEPLAHTPQRMREAGLTPGPVLVVTDETVEALYLDALAEAFRTEGWTPIATAIPAGEASKSIEVWTRVLGWALEQTPTRRTPIVALGGGVVGDLAGFVAATLLRGVPLVQLPTTVISQVDSAIGGKTGINHPAGKNLIGAFKRPAVVLADPTTLQTLSNRELTSGLAEAVKHALISEGELADTLASSWEALLARDANALARTIRDAAEVKATVVMADEFEGGVRAFLNFGHTFGHAIERATGYGTFTHGEAVALGIRAALHLSASLQNRQLADPLPASFAEADALVARIPTPALGDVSTDALMNAMQTDKKRGETGIRFVVLDAPGHPRLAQDVPDDLVRAAWSYARSVASD
ncbi:MAG: 3-dehydroquinate synthase [Rubricoccaceae bacterium]